MGIISCMEDDASSKDILLACMDWQCKSLRICAFELSVASLKKKVYMFLECEFGLSCDSLIFVIKASRVLVCYTR